MKINLAIKHMLLLLLTTATAQTIVLRSAPTFAPIQACKPLLLKSVKPVFLVLQMTKAVLALPVSQQIAKLTLLATTLL